MLRKALVILLLVCIVVSCDGMRKYAGGYRRYGHPDDILQLRKNGTFLKREVILGPDQTTHTGTWEVRGDEIYLTCKEWKAPYRIVEGKLIDNMGTEWKRD